MRYFGYEKVADLGEQILFLEVYGNNLYAITIKHLWKFNQKTEEWEKVKEVINASRI